MPTQIGGSAGSGAGPQRSFDIDASAVDGKGAQVLLDAAKQAQSELESAKSYVGKIAAPYVALRALIGSAGKKKTGLYSLKEKPADLKGQIFSQNHNIYADNANTIAEVAKCIGLHIKVDTITYNNRDRSGCTQDLINAVQKVLDTQTSVTRGVNDNLRTKEREYEQVKLTKEEVERLTEICAREAAEERARVQEEARRQCEAAKKEVRCAVAREKEKCSTHVEAYINERYKDVVVRKVREFASGIGPRSQAIADDCLDDVVKYLTQFCVDSIMDGDDQKLRACLASTTGELVIIAGGEELRVEVPVAEWAASVLDDYQSLRPLLDACKHAQVKGVKEYGDFKKVMDNEIQNARYVPVRIGWNADGYTVTRGKPKG